MPTSYMTKGGITVFRKVEVLDYAGALDISLEAIDTHRGAVFASGYEYPGRYSRWDIAFLNPPLEIIGRGRQFEINALNERGKEILLMIRGPLSQNPNVQCLEATNSQLLGSVAPMPASFREEDRSKQPTFFSVIRALTHLFGSNLDPHLGLYGAFGYDLVFQFEPVKFKYPRNTHTKDAHLFLPDEIIVVDHRREQARVRRYDFLSRDADTRPFRREAEKIVPKTGEAGTVRCDHAEGEYAEKVREIQRGCRRGDFFEVVLSQVFSTGYPGTPRDLFEAIRRTNPSPYEFLINLGDEQLVGASPEMFVRVEGNMVETCPIAGTVRRGRDAMEDADAIFALLTSKKDEAELTMCTDVDRNDKSRVCKAGSVQIIGRRMIEIYSRLFHTVDHVVGTLRDDCDAFDALLSHMWACTLTGAPKPDAMQRIEDLEDSPREWYGGAVGFLSFDGNLNTGITIRAVHLKDGEAKVRVGATLLVDSDPEEEERETRVKASAFLDAVLGKTDSNAEAFALDPVSGKPPRILFVDNRDSFVHTLANYVRQTGAEVTTLRAGFPREDLDREKPDLVFISPGPGRPEALGVPELVEACLERRLPVFGVCLGLQGIVLALGGTLQLLDYPMHGKPSKIINSQAGLFDGFPKAFDAGRYHSLYADRDTLPACLRVTAHTGDGVIMAVEHIHLPVAAVQFHPESIMTLKDSLGLKLIGNVVRRLAVEKRTTAATASKGGRERI